ncbi:MAG: ABC transporter ATP-binding protein [Clostridia bacterium]|nr:ABC transporter ATP-binding protein [Clostridia bacterium]
MRDKRKVDIPEETYSGKYAAYRKERKDEQRPENAKGTVKRFFLLIKPHSFAMSVVVFCALAGTVCTVITPEIMSTVINMIQDMITERAGGGAEISFRSGDIFGEIIKLAVIFGLSSVFSFLQEFVSAGVSQKLICTLRAQLNGKLSRLPLRYFDGQTKGQIISRITNDIENVSSSLQGSIITVMTSAIQVVGSLYMMLRTGNIWMTLAAIVLVPVSGSLSYFVSKKSKVWFRRYWDTMGDLNGHIEEMYAGHTIVRIFGHEKKSIDEFYDITVRLGKNSFMANMISGILNPVLTLIKNINYVSLCLLGGWFYVGAKSGAMQTKFGGIGDITKFLSYSGYFSSPIVNLSKIINNIQSSLASAERVFALMDEEEESPDDTTNDGKDDLRGKIEFRNVSFRYKEDVPLIDNLDLTAPAGSTTAIVGPTGAGKTTIVNLLMRFYDVNGGHIYLDGVDIYTMSRDKLRENFGMVLQDTWLFKGTIKENIRYGNASATDEEIEAAAKSAFIYDYIMQQPKGFDTELTEDGANLSQGQRQLLTIARAIVANPKVLILDEATSSVDTKTEQNIQVAMSELMKGRTSFVIAHRLSTIKNADNILVMKKGRIVEQGTHDQLLAADGFYALLYNSQYTDGIPPED